MREFKAEKLTLEDIEAELKRFENQFGMPTADFYEKYNRGEMGDTADVMEWAGLYEVKLIRERSHTRT